jgi:bifunctional DNA-binding transcriptional regulator/antitoxin component of YhaV-PrlF toxin-antitoxin module
VRELHDINPGDEVEIVEIKRGEAPVNEEMRRRARRTSLEIK